MYIDFSTLFINNTIFEVKQGELKIDNHYSQYLRGLPIFHISIYRDVCYHETLKHKKQVQFIDAGYHICAHHWIVHMLRWQWWMYEWLSSSI